MYQPELFKIPEHVQRKHNCSNPMVRATGFGPEGARCKTCHFLFCQVSGSGKRFYKCGQRGEATHGAATDHRFNWDACKKYIERKNKEVRTVYHG
jgi:hypothetical protein